MLNLCLDNQKPFLCFEKQIIHFCSLVVNSDSRDGGSSVPVKWPSGILWLDVLDLVRNKAERFFFSEGRKY